MRLLVVSDEPLLNDAISRLAASCEDITLIAFCQEYNQLIEACDGEAPTVILFAVSGSVDWAIVNLCRAQMKGAHIVLWTPEVPLDVAHHAFSVGVRGILQRNAGPELFLKCLRKVSEGELWFGKALTESVARGRTVSISRREAQLLSLVSQGLKNKEIATAMSISEGTVKVYLSRLFGKLHTKDRFELALLMLKNQDSGTWEEPAVGKRTVFLASSDVDRPAGPRPQLKAMRAAG